MERIFQQIASELKIKYSQVGAAARLLDEGATVPFIARYRKEVTESLNDSQLRALQNRLDYLRELEERKQTILNSIQDQKKLTPELEKAILNAETKTAIEDLYLPFKPKRRTRGAVAIEAGLQPLADALLADPTLEPEKTAESYINKDKEINDVKAALDGAKYILMERFSESATLLGEIRHFLWQNARLSSRLVKNKEEAAKKFTDYFNYDEALKTIRSHRVLAILRGRKEKFLQLSLTLQDEEQYAVHPCQEMIAKIWNITDNGRPADQWLAEVVRWTWKIKLIPQMETDLISQLREQAENEAIKVFSENLKCILLAAPAGPRVTMGLDPGLRTGVKVAIIDKTGQLTEHTTIYPHEPQKRYTEAQGALVKLILKHGVELIAIGNGTASRETDQLIADLMKQFPKLKVNKIMVSEAGASVYSASELAAKEFPDLDVVFRGAVSIARRLQDPLAELVKIDPKSIGVGQYQHDVSQSLLANSLDAAIEDCVNAVGVDLNTSSGALLCRVAGLNKTLADNIVAYRNQHGAFSNREQLFSVERLGDKTYEQAAGFLRIMQGDNPLDRSAVHPEAYPLIEKIATSSQRNIGQIIGDVQFLNSLNAENFIDDSYGLPTVTDAINEMKKPGRDPRPEFKMASFKEGIDTIDDLKPGMILEGVISNVTNFGAFVDIGVHQDGLVHISAISDRFIKNPRDVIKTGEIVKVKVLEVDTGRKRITLTMRINDKVTQDKNSGKTKKTEQSKTHHKKPNKKATIKQGTFAELFAAAKPLRK
ncbi:MAG: Tex family protein [Endozoicomonadaceae bacterium]|nr:Tex family protein [Endozoicomonadaceae bacterium]